MSKDLLRLLDATEENADIYDKNGMIEQRGLKVSTKGENLDWLNIVLFKSGGHFSYMKNNSVACGYISQHLDKLQRK